MNILLFGIAREIVGSNALTVPPDTRLQTVSELRSWLKQEYPVFDGLSSLAVAVNAVYAGDEDTLDAGSEIALIPPVSGG